MSTTNRPWDLWTFPTFILWCIFFLIGFVPENVYEALRGMSWVVISTAMVNSPHFITLAMAVYIAFFAYHTCLESGASRDESTLRAVQVGVYGLVAFFVYDFHILLYPRLPLFIRLAIYAVATVKLVAWLYLLIAVIRVTLFDSTGVFRTVTTSSASLTSSEPNDTPSDGAGSHQQESPSESS